MNIKIAPNLTKRRGKLLYDAVQSTEDATRVNFVYADAHGDLKIRLNDPHNGRFVFPFNTLEELSKLLAEMQPMA